MTDNKKPSKSAMNVMAGIDPPSDLNPEAVKRVKDLRRNALTEEDYFDGIRKQNRTILGQALTLIESSLDTHAVTAQKLIGRCLPYSGNSIRVGVTGVPGVGKSTFIEVFGTFLTSLGKNVAVLAIDPSSEKSKGSILGDKTRMETLSANAKAFIRPSPSSGSLGGVARKTRESVILCEAAGYDLIIIETVGVGQSETAVHSMTDFFLLLMLAGAGDELQGIKRGIMEMADLIAINKADGRNVSVANRARAQYQHALNLFPPPVSGWKPSAVTCSALTKAGISEIWENIARYRELTYNDYFQRKRAEQSRYWMHETINDQLKRDFFWDPLIMKQLERIEDEVINNKLNPFQAAGILLEEFRKKKC